MFYQIFYPLEQLKKKIRFRLGKDFTLGIKSLKIQLPDLIDDLKIFEKNNLDHASTFIP